jgi:hypothetical protein
MHELAHRLLQLTYYDAVDKGDMATAASALHEDVEWSHQQVWAHHGFSRGNPSQLRGRTAVHDLLLARRSQLAAANIRHRVRNLICDGNVGALIGYVLGPDSSEQPFMVWFELRDEKIAKYILRPI